MGRDRRGHPEQRAEEDPGLPPVPGRAGRGCGARRSGRTSRAPLGQRHPQLGAVQLGGAGRGDLRVADAATGGHQVDLARADQGVVAGGVPVLDLPGEQPAHRLQPGVRVRRDLHAAGVGDPVGTVVVDEAPRADQRALALRQRAAHGHRPRSAERDLPGLPAPRHRRRCRRPPGPPRGGRARGWSPRPQDRWCGSSSRSEPVPWSGEPPDRSAALARLPGPVEAHHDRLVDRLVALLRGRVERHQRVGLRVVGGHAAARLVVGHDPEGLAPPARRRPSTR